jgi:hypothetical protein
MRYQGVGKRACSASFLDEFFSETTVGSLILLGAGRTSGRLARLSEVAHGRKEVLIVPKGLSEKAENLLRRVVILGHAYKREDVSWRILVKTTAVGEDEYKAVAEELVEAGLAEGVDSNYAALRATPAGKKRVRGPGR